MSLTDAGLALRERALGVPAALSACIDIPLEDALELRRILKELLGALGEARPSLA